MLVTCNVGVCTGVLLECWWCVDVLVVSSKVYGCFGGTYEACGCVGGVLVVSGWFWCCKCALIRK